MFFGTSFGLLQNHRCRHEEQDYSDQYTGGDTHSSTNLDPGRPL